MPGSIPATSQLEWLSSTTAMIVLFWSRATRDLLRSFGWGIAALHRENAATRLPCLAARPIASFSTAATSCLPFGKISRRPGLGDHLARQMIRLKKGCTGSGEEWQPMVLSNGGGRAQQVALWLLALQGCPRAQNPRSVRGGLIQQGP